MISEWWLLLLLPSAAASGFWAAFSSKTENPSGRRKKSSLPQNYLRGVNFLLNEEPDKALDIFIELMEIDSDTIETHLALGHLFRRRGEVQRAIRIHQNLIARPSLESKYRIQALTALAKDYLSAGVLDRAERLFLELLELNEQVEQSLQGLLDIYQRERDWQKAIAMAKRLLVIHPSDTVKNQLAHYYCELADIDVKNTDYSHAQKMLRQALSHDKNHVRATLLFARIEIAQENYKKAIRLLKRIRLQDPNFISESILPLIQCYRALSKESELIIYLKDLIKQFPKMPIIGLLSEEIQRFRGNEAASSFVADYVREHPSVLGLHQWIVLQLAAMSDTTQNDLIIFQQLLEKLLIKQPTYQCARCGFATNILHWFCPSCKTWGTVKPIPHFDHSTD